jgi:uncharacterized membrane protein YphA (DoxX/SURF4 family)
MTASSLRSTRLQEWFLLALRLVIAGVFVSASLDKIIHPDRFADITLDYELLPDRLINLFAICLPWVELFLGLFLIVGRWIPSASLLATGLTLMFMAAISIGLAHGNEQLRCGCFSTSVEGGKEGAWGLLARDALLLAATIWLFIASSARDGAPQTTA